MHAGDTSSTDFDDWDDVTVVSLESLPAQDHKVGPFSRIAPIPLGRWGAASGVGFSPASAWRRAGMLWKTR